MKKILLALVAGAVAVGIAVPVAVAGPGATVTNKCPIVGTDEATTLPGCTFVFWNGNGVIDTYSPTKFNDTQTSSGNENEHFEGTIANNTGLDVIYTTTSPLTAGTEVPQLRDSPEHAGLAADDQRFRCLHPRLSLQQVNELTHRHTARPGLEG